MRYEGKGLLKIELGAVDSDLEVAINDALQGTTLKPTAKPDISEVKRLLETKGFVKDRDYKYLKPNLSNNTIAVLGIEDELTALKIQAALSGYASNIDDVLSVRRSVFGHKWGVSLYRRAVPQGDETSQQGGLNSDNVTYEFRFYPQLISVAQKAIGRLSEEGIEICTDYSSISPFHEFGGIEVAGIKNKKTAIRIHEILTGYTGFHIGERFLDDFSGEQGWHVRVLTKYNEKEDTPFDRGDILDIEDDNLDSYLNGRAAETEIGACEVYSCKNDQANLFVGYGLISCFDTNRGGDTIERIAQLRERLGEAGILLPLIRIRDNIELTPYEFTIEIDGVETKYVMDPKTLFSTIDGVERPSRSLKDGEREEIDRQMTAKMSQIVMGAIEEAILNYERQS